MTLMVPSPQALLQLEQDEGGNGAGDTAQTCLDTWQRDVPVQQECTGAEGSGYMVAVE